MSVHRIRLFHSETGAGDFHGWLDTWLTNMSPWDAPEVSNYLPVLTDRIDGDESYYRGEYAFAWSEDKAVIMDQLTGYLDAYCEWWRLAYHVCTHDEDDPSPCSWSDGGEGGMVPGYVPLLGVA